MKQSIRCSKQVFEYYFNKIFSLKFQKVQQRLPVKSQSISIKMLVVKDINNEVVIIFFMEHRKILPKSNIKCSTFCATVSMIRNF